MGRGAWRRILAARVAEVELPEELSIDSTAAGASVSHGGTAGPHQQKGATNSAARVSTLRKTNLLQTVKWRNPVSTQLPARIELVCAIRT